MLAASYSHSRFGDKQLLLINMVIGSTAYQGYIYILYCCVQMLLWRDTIAVILLVYKSPLGDSARVQGLLDMHCIWSHRFCL